jgi:hypothetical protein
MVGSNWEMPCAEAHVAAMKNAQARTRFAAAVRRTVRLHAQTHPLVPEPVRPTSSVSDCAKARKRGYPAAGKWRITAT